MTSVIAARARNRPLMRDRWDWCRAALVGYTQHKEDGSLTRACTSGKTELLDGCFAKGSVLMGLILTGVSPSSQGVAMPAASSLRAGITALYRRADLAPAVLIIAGISFLAHILVGNNYGYFRDELYVLAMSQHPAFGYVDVPPLVPWITLLPRLLTDNALWAIHVISALVCAGTIILTGLMARLLGGTKWIQGLAALGSATALVLLAGGSTYTYDVFDTFWWALCATILIALLRDDRPRRWLWFGVVAGLGVLTKETILFWGFALIVGLLLTPQRRLLFTRWTLFGGLIAFALFLPFLLWNAANGWASVQYWASYSHNHSAGGSPLDFLTNQILGMNPRRTSSPVLCRK